ncbi:uncharacterized protein RSE6_04212 [Rhynchosporium secalis]|uniref:Uncharacterized protein n=1 Tax=Rhynchosporium secalis TaxID=38038 RepID=A0A1E1M4R3_RHYSE|nr:uncharacterized protein RSE6_04212 [Rhynchosporium secalis]
MVGNSGVLGHRRGMSMSMSMSMSLLTLDGTKRYFVRGTYSLGAGREGIRGVKDGAQTAINRMFTGKAPRDQIVLSAKRVSARNSNLCSYAGINFTWQHRTPVDTKTIASLSSKHDYTPTTSFTAWGRRRRTVVWMWSFLYLDLYLYAVLRLQVERPLTVATPKESLTVTEVTDQAGNGR